ncbi:uncharacterized protein LOC131146018 [Malania oleifera]|uniref:uncharacterized protein LOC131146018 n=1 Tax=Malania oleifera TaxID=397392 RepID=UPI0025AE017B|nr:uncharacterized protein LOC131146018 [Malania oleifera]
MAMASLSLGCPNCNILRERGAISSLGTSALQLSQSRARYIEVFVQGIFITQRSYTKETSPFPRKGSSSKISKQVMLTIPKCSSSSNSNSTKDDSAELSKASFGYTRKDVLLIGLGVAVVGVVLKSGLEFLGVDPLQAGNAVQLIIVLGLMVGWISTYIFRVSNKEMTYAQQLRDYENKVMQKRLDSLTEAELEALLEQVEEEKRRFASRKRFN